MSLPSFVPTGSTDRRMAVLVRAFEAAFGKGHVAWAGFALFGGRTPDWLLQHTLEGTRLNLGPLLLSDALRAAAPSLAESVDPDRMTSFGQVSPFRLGAEIAEVLTAGGADPTTRWQPQQAHDYALAFEDALIASRYGEMVVLHSRAAWSAWFACEVWDRTWVIADGGTDHVWLLCVTDQTRRHPL